jgi:hypothetical protein
MCDRENDMDAEQEPEEIGDETVQRSLPKDFTKSQGKTTTFSYPGPILSSDDSEDAMSTPRRHISRIKARSKYLRCIQQFWPKFPRTHNAMTANECCNHGRLCLGLNKSTILKSAGGDSQQPRRLRRCTNQDSLRGRNYTSNRGGHATSSPSWGGK